MVQKKIVSKSDYIRFDSVLSKNAISFKKTFPYNQDLILDILYFIAYKFQQTPDQSLYLPANFSSQLKLTDDELYNFVSSDNIFSSGFKLLFDPKEFAEIMGYSKYFLYRYSPMPGYLIKYFGSKISTPLSLVLSIKNYNDVYNIVKQINQFYKSDFLFLNFNFDNKSLKDIKCLLANKIIDHFISLYPFDVHWNKLLDDAVWRAANEKLTLDFSGDTKSYNYAATGGVELLNKAYKFEDKYNKNKLYYAFFANENFIKHLTSYFSISSHKFIPQLRKKRCRNIAEYILDFRSKAHLYNYELHIDFDLAILLCNINISYPDFGVTGKKAHEHRSKIKSKITYKINQALKICNIPASLEWRKNSNHNYFYNPVVVFEHDDEFSQLKQFFSEKRFKDELFKRLYISFLFHKNLNHTKTNEKKYLEWLDSYDDWFVKNSVFGLLSKEIKEDISDFIINKSFVNYFPQYKT